MEENKLESIIRKIKGLLALAEDNSNDEEAQSAFVMAQKLMIKYNVELSQINDTDDVDLVTGQATAHKTVFWYEKLLARIIADNFRVKFYYNDKYVNNEVKRKRSVMFYGLEQDVKIAKELFVLANDALEIYTKRYIDKFYGARNRDRSTTTELKNSYMRGFTDGLRQKLKEQKNALQQEFGLVVLMPQVVIDGYEEFSKNFSKPTALTIPRIEDTIAYKSGLEDGKKIDYTKSTIDDEIFN